MTSRSDHPLDRILYRLAWPLGLALLAYFAGVAWGWWS